jgi:hypothetical protein
LPDTWTATGNRYQFHVEADATGGYSGWISATEELKHTGFQSKDQTEAIRATAYEGNAAELGKLLERQH